MKDKSVNCKNRISLHGAFAHAFQKEFEYLVSVMLPLGCIFDSSSISSIPGLQPSDLLRLATALSQGADDILESEIQSEEGLGGQEEDAREKKSRSVAATTKTETRKSGRKPASRSEVKELSSAVMMHKS